MPTLARLVPASKWREWYLTEKRSAPEITELIFKEYGERFSRQAVHGYIKQRFGTRTHKESMKLRVVAGRVDHNKIRDKIDYQNRKIDYQEIAFKRSAGYTGPLKNPRTKQISLPQPYIDRIRECAKARKKTISDTLKEIFKPLGWEYKKYILRHISQDFKSYTYDSNLLEKLINSYLHDAR